MPCAAGQHCKAPEQTPGPPHYTQHKCRKCGKYVHGMCGVQDPESSNECHRICGLKCLPAAQQPAGKGKGAAHRTRTTPLSSSNAGSTSSAKSGNAGAPSKKSAGGQKRSNLTLNTKMDVLEHLGKKVKPSAVAEKFGISDRTVRQIRKDAEKIKKQLEDRPQGGGAKSLKGPQHVEVSAKCTARCCTAVL